MSDVFQLPTGAQPQVVGNAFAQFGLEKNPFPVTGFESGVLYTDHMQKEVSRVNEWIHEVLRANSAFRPLAIFGSLGAGKTHLLWALERGLRSNQAHVLRRGLADEGMTRLVLANLILQHTPLSDLEDQAGEPATRLLQRIVGALHRSVFDPNVVLGEGSPLRAPLQALQQSSNGDPKRVLWLSRWMRREYTTPAQRTKLGLSGVLESEGQAIRAIGDLLRLARAANIVQVWFVMIDQLEELWREGVITPSRRARFLTDVRLLVDQALEGAPIAVLLAWNTTTNAPQSDDTSEHMQRDYLAFWQRLGDPVDLPLLKQSDIWPFAEAYLNHAGVTNDASDQKKKNLYDRLSQQRPSVTKSLQVAHDEDGLAPRQVLHEWRESANRIASSNGA
ncbi:MAG: hypothetical protein WBE26_18210 [Phycisphaerae bacterium]